VPGPGAAEPGTVPQVAMADPAAQDHSTRDKQFPGIYNDLNFLWAMVDTENGQRRLRLHPARMLDGLVDASQDRAVSR
jgi:hypothetical protein